MNLKHAVIYAIFLNMLLIAFSYPQVIQSYQLDESHPVLARPPGNSASHAAAREDTVWFGTGRGLTRTTDAGETWSYFRADTAFKPHGIYSIHIGEGLIWTSTGYTQIIDNNSLVTGSGYTYSTDGGESWRYVPQPLDDYNVDTLQYGHNKIPALGITTDIQNITYGVSSLGGTVWTASWAGGFRRSDDYGATWTRVILPPDNLDSISPDDELDFALSPSKGILISEGHLNHMGFSVHVASDSSVWAGTANGVNVSLDNGASWVKINAKNRVGGLLGSWVTRIADQILSDGTMRVWTVNWPTDSNERYGVSYTDDHGETWVNVLHNIQSYAFAFLDDFVYVTTAEGLMSSPDGGITWETSGSITDRHTRQRIVTREVLSVALSSPYVYVGTSEGIARTLDHKSGLFGYDWDVFRTFEQIAGERKTYAYPNPFSPSFTVTRLHYDIGAGGSDVTVELFDFSMNRVKTLIRNANRAGNSEHDEIWDGTDDAGRTVPNGVYFYRIKIDGDGERWGKVMVLR